MDPFISARSHAITAPDIFSPAPLLAGAQSQPGWQRAGDRKAAACSWPWHRGATCSWWARCAQSTPHDPTAQSGAAPGVGEHGCPIAPQPQAAGGRCRQASKLATLRKPKPPSPCWLTLPRGSSDMPARSQCVMGPGGSVLGPHGDPLLPGQGQVKSRQSGRRAGGAKERN